MQVPAATVPTNDIVGGTYSLKHALSVWVILTKFQIAKFYKSHTYINSAEKNGGMRSSDSAKPLRKEETPRPCGRSSASCGVPPNTEGRKKCWTTMLNGVTEMCESRRKHMKGEKEEERKWWRKGAALPFNFTGQEPEHHMNLWTWFHIAKRKAGDKPDDACIHLPII